MTETDQELALDATTRRALRAQAHALKPVVMVGAAGVSDAVLAETDAALAHHALIKVRFISGERDEVREQIAMMCRRLTAAPVQRIGRVAAIYRPKPDAEPTPRKARAPRAKRVRRR